MAVITWIKSHHLQPNASENGILEKKDLSISKSPSLPTPIARPSKREDPQSTIIHQTHGPNPLPLGDVWTYIPDWVYDSWRFPSVSGHYIAASAMSDIACWRVWRGPNLVDTSTDVRNVWRYIRQELGKPWLQSVNIQITGFCVDRSQAEPVWMQVVALHGDTHSSSLNYGCLEAVRAEILHRSWAFSTSWVRIMFCDHILHPKSLASEKPDRDSPSSEENGALGNV